jgi:hypothetical protein
LLNLIRDVFLNAAVTHIDKASDEENNKEIATFRVQMVTNIFCSSILMTRPVTPANSSVLTIFSAPRSTLGNRTNVDILFWLPAVGVSDTSDMHANW